MSDLSRLRVEYARRAQRLADQGRYSLFNQSNLFIIQQRQRAIIDLLQRQDLTPLEGKRILELGCGSGGVLLEVLSLGARASDLQGIDLLPQRLVVARDRLPRVGLICGDGRSLPYLGTSFDLLLQFTAFSSILDRGIQEELAREMLRVLRPSGAILWYDFWLNPTNRQTSGLRPGQIRALFPHCSFYFRRITLAPPLARRLVPLSWTLASLLEKLTIFNSHYLALIRPQEQ